MNQFEIDRMDDFIKSKCIGDGAIPFVSICRSLSLDFTTKAKLIKLMDGGKHKESFDNIICASIGGILTTLYDDYDEVYRITNKLKKDIQKIESMINKR